jgi:PadR family transcriptional regulator, regulatory protein PadR
MAPSRPGPLGCLVKNKMTPISILQGTLDLIILRTLATLGPRHAYTIATRLGQVSEELLKVNQGTLYPALVRLKENGWIKGIVTATTPTTSGEGKTVVSIGLAQGLERETGAVLRANESSKWAAPFTPTLTSNFPKYANFGEGKTDWKKMMTELKKAGVKQTFIEQDGTASNDELGAVRQAYDYLLKV